MIALKHSPETFWQAAWQTLKVGIRATLTDCGPSGSPRSRTVVLRKSDCNTAELWAYTDRRSAKANGMEGEKKDFHWLIWDEQASIQFSGSGSTRWLNEEESRVIFTELPKHSLRAYATRHAPGTNLPGASNDLPKWWEEDELTPEQYDTIRQNFGVLVTRLERADVLYLSREANIRMRARRRDVDWNFSWITP
jgi:hypothetical protein